MRFGASTFIWVSPFSNRCLDLLRKIHGMGFDVVEICLEDLGTIDPAAIRPILEETGLGVLTCGVFGPDRDISSDDARIRQLGMDYLFRAIDLSHSLGARVLGGPMYSAVGKTRLLDSVEREKQRMMAVEGIQRAADHAQPLGIRLAVEPLNRFETDLLNTVDQSLEFLRLVDRSEVGLLLDTFHMNIEERSVPDALRRASDRIFHFHACANDRGTPGRDHLAWPMIVTVLRDVGYSGDVVIEAFNPAIREIARAVSLWRPLAESEDALAQEGLAFLREVFKPDA
jgi:D-psicose/D-tagatose/L-ribulose 3-epimerase